MTFSVSQLGKKLKRDKYTWDEKTRTFSTVENNLVLDFRKYNNCTFNTGWNCKFKTGNDCTFDTCSGCTFDTGSGCTFRTGDDCTFDTRRGCTFDTGSGCTFNTGWNCTFDTGCNCTFDTGDDCVIIRRDVFEIIQPELGTTYKLCPYKIPGYLTKEEDENAFYIDINGKRVEHIIADGILSKVVKKKGNVYHVINYDADKETFLIKDGEIYSHGDTLKQARESLKYKIADRDTTEFKKYKLDDELDLTTLIRVYRAITGACEAGTRYFCENNTLPEKMTLKKAIELTQGQYNHEVFRKFFEEKENGR